MKNKTGLITGATSGIGLAISILLAKEGAKLFLLGRNFKNLKDQLGQIEIKNQPEFIEIDMSNSDSLEKKMHSISQMHQMDFLIHSAGLIQLGLFENSTMQDFDDQYAVNVRAAFQITRLLLPNLKQSKGTIIYLNSTAGLDSWENLGIYSSTKHALKALSTSLRKEMKEFQVKVTNVFLGSVDTPMQEKVQSSRNKVYDSDSFIDPQHVARVVLNILELPLEINISDITILGNKG